MGNPKSNSYCRFLCLLVVLFAMVSCSPAHGQVPAFAGESQFSAAKDKQTAVLAGGCFWGVDAVFRHVRGVKSVVSGYSGGTAKAPSYDTVSTGKTGHAESVKITYDASKVRYSDLLRIFFSVATDPTQLNQQGPDTGSQYRSVIFYTSEDQKQTALAYVEQLNKAKVFSGPIVTAVVPLNAFYTAERYHQDYLALHPDDEYIVYNDLPKLRALKKEFPDLYK